MQKMARKNYQYLKNETILKIDNSTFIDSFDKTKFFSLGNPSFKVQQITIHAKMAIAFAKSSLWVKN